MKHGRKDFSLVHDDWDLYKEDSEVGVIQWWGVTHPSSLHSCIWSLVLLAEASTRLPHSWATSDYILVAQATEISIPKKRQCPALDVALLPL